MIMFQPIPHLIDIDGISRGKLIDTPKFKKSVDGGFGMLTTLDLSVDIAMTFGTRPNGYIFILGYDAYL
jgi:hypothetical protein